MFTVAALYRFTRLKDPDGLRAPLRAICAAAGVKGTLLLAPEGINGTIAGPRAGVEAVIGHIREIPGCAGLECKDSNSQDMPFNRLRVRLKREIVTMGQPQVDPTATNGAYIEPRDWNAVIRDPETIVIDTRNDYEVALGTFRGAIDPHTASFGDFPAWWRENRAAFAGKRIAMFCTGGIRCEKSTNYLLGEGVQDVVHLKGGILKYLEDVPQSDSLWDGACFVFDGRVSVTHGLAQGPRELCHACRRPLEPGDLTRPDYEKGVACHHCVGVTSATDKAGFRERQRQIALAQARGTRHMGS